MARYRLDDTSTELVEPLDIAAVKLHLVLEHDEQDRLIPGMISAARTAVEEYTGVGLSRRTGRYSAKQFPNGHIQVPKYPVVSIDTMGYLDADKAAQTIDVGTITLYDSVLPYTIWIEDIGWPSGSDWYVTFTYGYQACDVPASLIRAMLIHIGWQWDQRGDNPGNDRAPMAFYCLCDQHNVGEEFDVYP